MSYQPADFAAEIALNVKEIVLLVFEREVGAHADVDRSQSRSGSSTTRRWRRRLVFWPGQPTNSRYINDITLIINKGKGGNLTAAQMGAAMDAVVAAMP